MHILITTDTVGGVWSYTRELVTGLVRRGIKVTLVSFGGIPGREQSAWLERLPGIAYFPTRFRLEWMQEAGQDLEDSARYLLRIIGERSPELLHLSQYYYGALDVKVPKLVVAHSDVMSWNQTVHGAEPVGRWAQWYRAMVERGLAGASLLVAPSHWMLGCMDRFYGGQRLSQVIYNGRSPELFLPQVSKLDFAASAGRLWDEGKQSRLLIKMSNPPLPIFLAGAASMADEIGETEAAGRESAVAALMTSIATQQSAPQIAEIRLMGELPERGMRELLSRAAIYIATSKYEPFGLAPLEAALSGCAILANDIGSLREVWGDAAMYFRSDDSESLATALKRLYDNRELRMEYASRAYEHALQHYTAERMVDNYVHAYTALLDRQVVAA